MTVASPPPPPGAPAPKKGMGPLGWIAIGCGAIALLGFLVVAVGGYMFKKKVVDPALENPALAAAEAIVRVNPELEVVSSDPKAGTLEIRNTKTGETITMNAEDIKNGKLTFKTDQGQQLTIGGEAPKNLPAWVPVYPGSTVTGATDATNAQGRGAQFAIASDDPVDKVVEFFERKLGEAGLKVSKTVTDTNGQHSAVITANSEDSKRTFTAMIGQQDGKTQGAVTFEEKK